MSERSKKMTSRAKHVRKAWAVKLIDGSLAGAGESVWRLRGFAVRYIELNVLIGARVVRVTVTVEEVGK